jgi:hypothetical protein
LPHRRSLAFALLALAALSTTSFGRIGVSTVAGQAGGTPLRQVDWNSFLASDPAVQSSDQSCIPPPPGFQLGPCVSVALPQPAAVNGLGGPGEPPVTEFGGYADTADILYADLDGDGLEEAVIPTQSTGTGGSFGFLVYHQAAPNPRLAVAYPGYKLGVRLEQGVLVVSQPFYFGYEANCCPTALTQHRYLLGDAGLYDVADVVYSLFLETGYSRSATPAEVTVAAFYRAINRRDYPTAYSLVTPEGRMRRSLETFTAGYAATRSVMAMVAPGDTENEVRVDLTTDDVAPGGSDIVKRFAGSWFVIFDPTAPLGVYLSSASIQQVSP